MGPELDGLTWTLVVLAGGLLAVDGVSWLQTMASRPLAAGTVGGALLGDPGAGIVAGMALELLFLRHLPFGAARYPEAGPAGLVAGAAYAGVGGGDPVALAAAVLAGWGVGWLGAESIRWLRELNGRILARAGKLGRVPSRLERRQRFALALDFVRGCVLTAAVLVPTILGVRLAATGFHPDPTLWPGILVALAVGIAAGAGGRALARSEREGWLLVVGGGVVLAALALGLVPGALAP